MAHVIPVQMGATFYAPTTIPTIAKQIVDSDDLLTGTGAPNGVVGGTDGGDPNGIIGGILRKLRGLFP